MSQPKHWLVSLAIALLLILAPTTSWAKFRWSFGNFAIFAVRFCPEWADVAVAYDSQGTKTWEQAQQEGFDEKEFFIKTSTANGQVQELARATLIITSNNGDPIEVPEDINVDGNSADDITELYAIGRLIYEQNGQPVTLPVSTTLEIEEVQSSNSIVGDVENPAACTTPTEDILAPALVATVVQIGPGTTVTTVSDALVFQVQAQLGTNSVDGTGIQQVEMQIQGPDGAVVHQMADNQAPYCAFGGTTCNTWSFANHNNLWPNDTPIEFGPHTLAIEVQSTDERVFTSTQAITLVAPTALPEDEQPQPGRFMFLPSLQSNGRTE